jgi:hypothetical protein
MRWPRRSCGWPAKQSSYVTGTQMSKSPAGADKAPPDTYLAGHERTPSPSCLRFPPSTPPNGMAAGRARTRSPATAFWPRSRRPARSGRGTGWHPSHLVARLDGPGRGRRALPISKPTARANTSLITPGPRRYERAGGRYYPKLQCAVPFTPVTGPRLIATSPAVQAALLQAMAQVAQQNGPVGRACHLLHRGRGEAGRRGRLSGPRSEQFHWLNHGYASFDDFLAQLSSRKRKAIRKERERAQGFGGTIRSLTGDQIRPEHWDAFWAFYQDTGGRKWGRPYLTREFFDILHDTMRDDCLLVLAERDGVPVAGALNLIGRDALYGRYWGCLEDHPSCISSCAITAPSTGRSPGHPPGRGRRAGRTQAGARLSAQPDPFAALGRG